MQRGFLRVLRFLAILSVISALAAMPAFASSDAVGAVYTQTNKTANEVLVFARGAGGSLSSPTAVSTHGAGTGTGLGSQGAVTVSADGRWLFVVNAGSNDVSSFAIRGHELAFVDVVASGGARPTSVTVAGGLVYVLNAGTPNISGFTLTSAGLSPLAGSARALPAGANPAQIQFSRSGDVLIITERATSKIMTFAVGRDGITQSATTTDSNGVTPFGFAVGLRNEIFVTEAAASTASSYTVARDGRLTSVSARAETGERAACWAAITKDGRYLFTANAASDSLSTFAVAPGGGLTLRATTRLATGAHPLDLAVSENGQFLYALLAAPQRIGAFTIGADGTLNPIGEEPSTLMGDGGLAAR